MKISKVVGAQSKFRRDIASGTQLDHDQRTRDSRASPNRLAIVNRDHPFAIADQSSSARNWLRLSLLMCNSLRPGARFRRSRTNPDIHDLDRGVRRRMSKGPPMRRMKIRDEAWRQSDFK